MLLAASTVLAPGASDCELLRPGWLAQPANTISSFAFVIAGVVVAVMVSRSGAWRARSLVYAGCLVAIGLGSVAYHGPQPPGAELVHDLSIDYVLALIALHDLSLLRPRFRRVVASFVISALTLSTAAVLVPVLAALAADVLIPLVIFAEVLVYRGGQRPQAKAEQQQLVAIIVLSMIIAGGLFARGRTGSSLCDPTSLLQLHAGWHIAAAVVFVLWWRLALVRAPSSFPAAS